MDETIAGMTGVLSWIAAGVGAALLARLVARRRKRLWLELLAGAVAAVVAGLAATWLDFGGVAALDARGIAFAFLAAACAVALVRL